ncbi:MAG: DNA adenine methylase [Candidatus Micrarchaeota archaeon]
MEEAKPFVKWAGGKRQLLKELMKGLPEFENYHEPFLGGGALFFHLEALGRIKKAYLTDSNEELVNAYEVIKTDVEALIGLLSSGKFKNDKETFYAIRADMPKDRIERAARFIYLNKTAFNGLYRVNSQGKFNVPFGKYRNPKILDKENLLLVNRALQKDHLTCNDFDVVLSQARNGDFVYFDPPYIPISRTASFTSYTATNFSEKDQQRLFSTFQKLDRMGCSVMLSNSYSDFIAELYEEYKPDVVLASRAINCKPEGRGKIKEIIVRNWQSIVA